MSLSGEHEGFRGVLGVELRHEAPHLGHRAQALGADIDVAGVLLPLHDAGRAVRGEFAGIALLVVVVLGVEEERHELLPILAGVDVPKGAQAGRWNRRA